MSEQFQFQTEVGRLLDIVTHALYTEKEIFLRELISNASDACDRLRYEAIASPGLSSGDTDYKIRLIMDAEARTLTVLDNGIGMSREELVKNLGTIAHSGTKALLDSMEAGARGDVSLIGQFGVGFYSAFMVADRVEVLSRKAGEETAWLWVSDGRSGYTIEESVKDFRGTTITLHIRDDASEFLLAERLKQVVKKYSDHIAFPILLGVGDAAEKINAAGALWMRPKAEVTVDQYKEFYRHINNGFTMDEPWMTLHWKGEGAVEHANLLFIPGMKPFDLYDPRRHHGVKLYVRRVFIMDAAEGLIPPFLRFVKGVVDCEDLPLNISREMLQKNPAVARISSAVTRKILGELQKSAETEPEKFAQFWALFGPVVKEGLYDAHAYRDLLTRVARFHSTHGTGLVSLDDYVSRMKEGQENIYYIAGPDLDGLRHSPQIEAFRARGVEVLLMTDTIDEFWVPMQSDFRGKKFKSVTRGSAELAGVRPCEDATPPAAEQGGKVDELIARLKEILGGEVRDVCLSERLVDSPVCLVAPEGEVDIHMQRLLKKNQGYEGGAGHILEINAGHPVIARLQALAANDGKSTVLFDAAFLLLDQARIIEGEPLKNPAEFARRMSRVMEKGLLIG